MACKRRAVGLATAENDDGYESDVILVKSRRAFDDMDVDQTQNRPLKRVRYLKSVSISTTPLSVPSASSKAWSEVGEQPAASSPGPLSDSSSVPSRPRIRPQRVRSQHSYTFTAPDLGLSENDIVESTEGEATSGSEDDAISEASDFVVEGAQESDDPEEYIADDSESQDKDKSSNEEHDASDIWSDREGSRTRKNESRSGSTARLGGSKLARVLPEFVRLVKDQTCSDAGEPRRQPLKSKKRMINLQKLAKGEKMQKKSVKLDLPPLSDISEIFEDITEKALRLGFARVTNHLYGRPLKVATMCSGTESPLLALTMVQDALKKRGADKLEFDHLFSAEIEPFKQAYIERNFQPPIIFRDIREIIEAIKTGSGVAFTAYGAEAEVPRKVDIVIAGTSCVDYSLLNNRQKAANEQGESRDTFLAVLAYARAYRPPILILENVFGAPWDELMLQYEEASYVVAGVHVDTKEYYLPQTRTRGYMLCLDIQAFGKKAAAAAASEWVELMKSFKRPASSTIGSFLLQSDDPRTIQAKRLATKQSRFDKKIKEVNWAQCEIRHQRYREINKLGLSRPLTNWEESGSLTIPEYADRDFFRRQVERVWDFTDMSLLRKAASPVCRYDVQYKMRVWDVSQNIDIFTDTSPFGIAPCLTPDGMFYVSDRGALLTHYECIALQGIPLEKISFTTETRSNVQNLAGNAMSSTVVGSAILSALIAGHKGLSQEPLDPKVMQVAQGLKALEAQPYMTTEVIDRSVSRGVDIQQLLKLAGQSSRRCLCEGQTELANKAINICDDCGHTVCVSCSGNPAHNFSSQQLQKSHRSHPFIFEATLRSQLPMRLRVTLPASYKNMLTSKAAGNEKLISRLVYSVQDACNEVFSFRQIQRRSSWTVEYDNENGRLELVISGDSIVWQLFANPGKDLAGNDALRLFLLKPIARARPADSLLCAPWEWSMPYSQSVEVRLAAAGKPVPSWFAGALALPKLAGETVPSEFSVETDEDEAEFATPVSGQYKYLPACGTSCSSLYKRDDAGGNPMFLFHEPDRISDPELDCFVFASDCSRLSYSETREPAVRLDPSWRPWLSKSKKATVQGTISVRWIQDENGANNLTADDTRLTLAYPKAKGSLSEVVPVRGSCDTANILMSCSIPYRGERSSGIRPIELTDRGFFSSYAWALQQVRDLLPTGDWHAISARHYEEACMSCAPAQPATRWHLTSNDKSVKPFEDPKSATKFERSLKSRPEIFVVQHHVDQQDIAHIRFGLNVLSLAHRAIAKLPGPPSECSVCWKLETSFNDAAEAPLPDFKLTPNDPARSHNDDLHANFKLWLKQRQSLAWMLGQEAGEGCAVHIEEAEEASLSAMCWRVEARSSRCQYVRGGILADHPGFGKTLTSLALIQEEWVRSKNSRKIIETFSSHSHQHVDKRFIRTAATLIVVPTHLVSQWLDEIKQKLNYKGTVLTIRTPNELSKLELKSFENARIILVSQNLFTLETYGKRLARFAAVPQPASMKGRSYKAWLGFVRQDVLEHVDVLRQGSYPRLKKLIDDKFERRIGSEEFQEIIPSKRLKGKHYTAAREDLLEKTQPTATAKAKPGQASDEDDIMDVDFDDEPQSKSISKSKSKSKSNSTLSVARQAEKELQAPLFEMFHYNRIIVDEFTYLDMKERAAISALSADKRWALSATPPLGDFFDVASIANLIGIKLRIGDDGPGNISAANAKAIRQEMTNAEQFRAFRHAPSYAMNQRTHELHQKFLDDFVRQNILEHDIYKFTEMLQPIELDLDHRATYTELSQHLNSQDMRIKKSEKGRDDRTLRLFDSMKGAETAEEALLKAAGSFVHAESIELVNEDGLDRLIRHREDETKQAQADLTSKVGEAQDKAAAKGNPSFESWKHAITVDKVLGDKTTEDAISDIIRTAEKRRPSKGGIRRISTAASEGEDEEAELDNAEAETKKDKKDPLKVLTAEVAALSKRFLACQRSVRFAKNVLHLHSHLASTTCDDVDCNGGKGDDGIFASSLCGHLVCAACHQRSKSSRGMCGAAGCRAPVKDFHLLSRSKVRRIQPSANARYDAKTRAVADLLTRIQADGEQAILFVRYNEQTEHLVDVLKFSGIKFTAVLPAKSDPKALTKHTIDSITKFQQDNNPKTKSTVILLNAADQSAAGTNLTNANHVLFLSPLLMDSQYEYEASMAQTIGRVRRPGQAKHVYIYRFVALDTIDVDILEHRERRADALTEQGAPAVVPPGASAPLEKERTQLVCENGQFSLRPRSWLHRPDVERDAEGVVKVEGRDRVKGWEDFSSLVKFSRAYSEGDQ